jgi:hypothetical protein
LSPRPKTASFDAIQRMGLKLPDVEAATKYDGSPVLKVGGAFMAGLASHDSADADTLVVRCDLEDRERMIEDAPDTYYVTEYYAKYPLVLVRLSHVNTDALRDLLAVSRQLTLPKARKPATGSRAAVRRAARGSRGRRAPR